MNQYIKRLSELGDTYVVSKFFDELNRSIPMHWEEDSPTEDFLFYSVQASDLLTLMTLPNKKIKAAYDVAIKDYDNGEDYER